VYLCFFFQAEDGIRDRNVTGVQTCALPICTYYGFQNDNAPVLQVKTAEKYFSFVVRTQFESKHRFDQCGIVIYLDSENWLKASIEYENESYQRLGSVVTNHGYSDWATTDIPATIKEMW